MQTRRLDWIWTCPWVRMVGKRISDKRVGGHVMVAGWQKKIEKEERDEEDDQAAMDMWFPESGIQSK